MAVELARAGYDVVLTGTGRAPERYPDDEQQAGRRDIHSVAEEVRALGRRALPVISDVSDPEAVDCLLAEVLGIFGRVDIIVNNAAAARGADRVPVIDLDIDLWRTVIDVNLNSTFYVGRAFGRAIAEQGNGGSIVNSSSDAAKMMSARTAAYSASKAGIHALTCAMASELGGAGVRVNAICPGIVDTYRLDDIPCGRQWDDFVARAAGTRQLRRGHHLDDRLPVLGPGLLDHGPALQRQLRDPHRPLNQRTRSATISA
jgi:3-oxoacyl-[acyl-carrier protein] reductase